jgi:hypothetical protein
MARPTDASDATPHKDKNHPGPSPVETGWTPGVTGSGGTTLPPAGSDAARNLERKTGPDRNRGSSQP